MPDFSMGDLVSLDYQPQQDLGGYTPTDWANSYTNDWGAGDVYAGGQGNWGASGGNGYLPGNQGGLNVGQDYAPAQYLTGTPDILSSRGMYGPQSLNTQTGWNANPYAAYDPAQSFGMNTPNFGTDTQTFAPSLGRPTGSAGAQQASQNQDDWKKVLLKGGINVGTGLATAGLGSLISGAMAPKQQTPGAQFAPQSSATQTQVSQMNQPVGIPTAAPMLPLPGTQASPLISGFPTQVNMSTGLKVDPRRQAMGGLVVR